MNIETILIKNPEMIITQDKYRNSKKGDILIEKNLISAIGDSKKFEKKADVIINAKGKIVIPGLINTHHHLDETLIRCVPELQNLYFEQWAPKLYKIKNEMTTETLYYSAIIGICELLLTGCTTMSAYCNNPSVKNLNQIDIEIKAAKDLGIRFHPCNVPPRNYEIKKFLNSTTKVIKKYHDINPFSMCKIAVGGGTLRRSPPDFFIKIKNFAKKHKILRHCHYAETFRENDYCQKKYGKNMFKYFQDVGWFDDDVWLAHCIHVPLNYIRYFSSSNTGISHCPTSNMRLGNGVAPIPMFLQNQVKVGLGVDGCSCNDTSNMLSELRTCLLIHSLNSGPNSININQIFDMATLGGAHVLRRETEIGSIEVGKAADIVLIDINQIGFTGAIHDPKASLILCGNNSIVDTSIINGKIIVKNGKIVKFDENELYNIGNSLSFELLNRRKI